MLEHFQDHDTRVRCTACETMYNVCKVARSHTLPYFNKIFVGLANLAGDQEVDVRNNHKLVDQLLKDHVTAYGDEFDVAAFIPVLKDLLQTEKRPVRQFLIEWIKVLHDVPDIDMLSHLPNFVDGIFEMLSDRKDDDDEPYPLHKTAYETLKEFEEDLKEAGDSEYAASEFEALIPHLKKFCHSTVIFRRTTALKWVADFILLCTELVIPDVADIIDSFLPSYSHADQKRVSAWAGHIQGNLENIIKMTEKPIDYQGILAVLVTHLDTQPAKTQCAAMRWMNVLFRKNPDEVLQHMDLFFDSLVGKLSASEDEVAQTSLMQLILIANRPDQFCVVLEAIMAAFERDSGVLRTRGHRFICLLGTQLGAEKVYREMASVIIRTPPQSLERLERTSTMVQTLNELLLTASEFQGLQRLLRKGLTDPQAKEFFLALYPSWCYNVISTVSLCLLTSAHRHANRLLSRFGDIRITTAILMQIDRLVLLLESPSYTFLRLQLLEPTNHPELIKGLYGILMLLPQSDAYHKLKSRLDCINTLAILPLHTKDASSTKEAPGVNFESMTKHFDTVVERHMEARRQEDDRGSPGSVGSPGGGVK